MAGISWSESEINILKEHWDDKNFNIHGALPRRTKNAAWSKAQRLTLPSRSSGHRKIELGNKYNRLTVIGYAGKKEGSVLWRCKCDCGNIITLSGSHLRGTHKSCGCLKEELLKSDKHIQQLHRMTQKVKLKKGEAARNNLYLTYENKAEKRDLEFDLTHSQFEEITKGKCYYCGSEPENIYGTSGNYNGAYIYNGIDRIDSGEGYILSNCVPCCKYCNWAKMDMPKYIFLEHIKKIYRHSISKKKASQV